MHVEDKDLVPSLSEQAGPAGLEAAVYARIETPLSPARWLGPLGNYLVARPAARAAAHRATEKTELPLDAAIVLGVGGNELHVWSADPMLSQVKEHLGSVPVARITKMTTEIRKGWWSLTLAFAEGETLELSARGDVSGLAAAFERQR